MLPIASEIQQDFLEPITYLPYGIFFASLFLILLYFMERSRKQRGVKGYFLYWLFLIYIVVVLIQAFFSREPGSRTGIDIHLFETWANDPQSHAYFIENILMCMPLGIFLPLLSNKFRLFRRTIPTGFLFSVCIELLQLLTQRGYCQLDDIVTNTVGTAVGFLCWIIFRRVHRSS